MFPYKVAGMQALELTLSFQLYCRGQKLLDHLASSILEIIRFLLVSRLIQELPQNTLRADCPTLPTLNHSFKGRDRPLPARA